MANILLVDDDIAILKFSEKILTHYGHNVVTTGNVLDAIEKVKHNSFDLLLTDANMPRFSGYDLVKTVRAEAKYKHLAVAMLTARREKADIQKAIDLGIDDYIIKPITAEVFVQKVQSLIDRKTQSRKSREDKTETLKIQATGHIRMDIQITEITEFGVVFESPQFFDNGLVISIGSLVLSERSLQLPPLKVNRSTTIIKNQTEIWETRAIFCGATDGMRKQISRWILEKKQEQVQNAS